MARKHSTTRKQPVAFNSNLSMRSFILILGVFMFSFLNGHTQPTDKLKPLIPELPFMSLEDAGFNKDSIAHLLKLIQETSPNDFRGLVVIKDNKLVLEEYYNTYWRNTIHDIRSAGKSVTALLLGIALKEGLVKNLEQDVYSFFPVSKYPHINKGYKNITLRHLLTMASGLDATDNPQTAGHVVNWIARDDWKDYLLQVSQTSKAGSAWVYADINPLIIAAIIEQTSGLSLKEYAKQKLFDPLGIEQFYWYTNAANQTGAAGNLYLSTLDFAKLGLLVLNKGLWKNTQLIDSDYIKSLSIKSFDLKDNNPYSDAYGLLWYTSQRTFGGKKIDYMFASGNGGNQLIVIPEKEIVIALTSSAYGQGYGHGRSYNIMSKILAALR